MSTQRQSKQAGGDWTQGGNTMAQGNIGKQEGARQGLNAKRTT